MSRHLFVIEGTDGSGKSTQAALTAQALTQAGVDFTRLTFPRYQEESSALLRMYLRGDFGRQPGDVNPYAASTFFAVDRYASFKTGWQRDWEAGKLIFCDRYTTSNAVHQSSKLPEGELEPFTRWLFDYEYNLLGLPAHYIYAAATLPQYRGAGRMASLLTQAAEEGRARGQQYSILIVQEPGLLRFYEKNGYRSQVVWNALSLSREGLRAGETLRPAEERDIPALGEIYEKAAQNAPHGARSRENWLDNLGIYEKNAVVLEKQGAVKAYCFADPAGASEAAGEDAARLAGLLLPENAPVSTPRPGGAVRLCGSIRPLTESARVRLGDEPVYLDLMYN